MPELSICIPTYNRADLLAKSLRTLLGGLREHGWEEKIEVCVSDNASTDLSPQVLADLGREFPELRYRRNVRNLGFGGNLWSVVKFAKSEFVVLVGDDDEVSLSAIVDVRATLQQSRPDLLLVNSAPGHMIAKTGNGARELQAITGLDGYLTKLGAFHATFIGNLVFRRQAFLDVPEGAYIADSAYPHMIPVLSCLCAGKVHFLPIMLVKPDDRHRDWRVLQPIYTAIDLAQIYALFGLPFMHVRLSSRIKLAVYLARSLPKVWRLVVTGKATTDPLNSFRSTRLSNILSIYAGLLFARAAVVGDPLKLRIGVFSRTIARSRKFDAH